MTQQDFEKQAKRLINAFGAELFNAERLKLIFHKCSELDAKWLEKLVTQMILNGNAKVDFAELIANERARSKAVEIKAETEQAISEHGLSDVLKKFRANSLLDAIQNYDKNTNAEDMK